MIKRINGLKNIGCFEELTYTRGTEGDFSKFNVIYAKNACGKSTLCDVLRSLNSGEAAYVVGRQRLASARQPEVHILLEDGRAAQFQNGAWQGHDNCSAIHIYDDRFVSEHVLIGHHINVNQRRKLYGLVIGENANALQEAVNNAERQLSVTSTALTTAGDRLNSLIPQGYTIDTYRNLPAIDDVDSQIESVTRELSDSEQVKAKADAIQARETLRPLPVAETPQEIYNVLTATLSDAALSAEQKIREHMTATSSDLPINWMKQGHEAQTGTACPHCGQDMQGLEILNAYRSFFSGELQSQERRRNSVSATIQSAFGGSAQQQLQQILTAHETEQTWWRDAASYTFELPPLRSRDNILEVLQQTHKAMTDALARKAASPGAAVIFTPDETAALSMWRDVAAELNTYNENLAAVNEGIMHRKAESASVDIASLKNRQNNLTATRKRYEQATVDAYAAYDAALQNKTTAQQVKQQANDALREESNQLFDRYGARINELLDLFQADFNIVNDGVNFRGGAPSGQLAVELHGTRVASSPEVASLRHTHRATRWHRLVFWVVPSALAASSLTQTT